MRKFISRILTLQYLTDYEQIKGDNMIKTKKMSSALPLLVGIP